MYFIIHHAILKNGVIKKMKKKEHTEIVRRLSIYAKDERLKQMKKYVQHGNINTYEHCLLVAYYSFLIMKKLRIKCNEDELLRGALLHDYYLYDWHIKEKWHRWHGFRHANFALANALQDFHLTEIEMEIIRKHMWPLTIIPPTCREAWIVNIADTFISFIETIAYRKKSTKMLEYWILYPLSKIYNFINVIKE